MSVTLRRPGGEELTFDVSENQSWSPSVNITDHPIEDRVNVADHVQELQDRVSFPARLSASPLGDQNIDPVQRLEDALRFLNTAGKGGELLELETRLGVSQNWLLEEWPHDVTRLRGLTFSLSLRQVRIANVELVSLPREVPRAPVADTAPPEVDVGTQPTEEVDDAEAEKVREDVAWSIRLDNALTGGRLFGGGG